MAKAEFKRYDHAFHRDLWVPVESVRSQWKWDRAHTDGGIECVCKQDTMYETNKFNRHKLSEEMRDKGGHI